MTTASHKPEPDSMRRPARARRLYVACAALVLAAAALAARGGERSYPAQPAGQEQKPSPAKDAPPPTQKGSPGKPPGRSDSSSQVTVRPPSIYSCLGRATRVRLFAWRPLRGGDELIYRWDTGGVGQIEGKGSAVAWNLSGVPPGAYRVTVKISYPPEPDSPEDVGIQAGAVRVEKCPASCPDVSIACPQSVREGEPINFVGSIPGVAQLGHTFTPDWAVSDGATISGRFDMFKDAGETTLITVGTAGFANRAITATLSFDLPGLQCRASCTTSVLSTTAPPTPGAEQGSTPAVVTSPTAAPPTPPTPTPTPPTPTPVLSPIAPPPSVAPSPVASPGAPAGPSVGGERRVWPWLLAAALCALLVGALHLAHRAWRRANFKIGIERPHAEPASVPPGEAVPQGSDGGPPRGSDDVKEVASAGTGGVIVKEEDEAGAAGAVAKEDEVDELQCTAFAPYTVARGDSFLVQVFAHLASQSRRLAALARRADPEAAKRDSVELDAAVAPGDELIFELSIPGLEVREPSALSLVWRGRPAAVKFDVAVPADCAAGSVTASVNVYRLSVPVGRLAFKLRVAPSQAAAPAPPPEPAREQRFDRYRYAFISYASEDRAEVLRRIQVLPLVEIDYFKDVIDLDPGARWERELYREIDKCDVFFLFWSRAARDSEWVRREVLYALEHRRGEDGQAPAIKPVIIEGPPPVPPPDELKGLHFNDKIMYFIFVEDYLRAARRRAADAPAPGAPA